MEFQTAIQVSQLQVRKNEIIYDSKSRILGHTIIKVDQIISPYFHVLALHYRPFYLCPCMLGVAYAECGVGEEHGTALQVTADEGCTTDKVIDSRL